MTYTIDLYGAESRAEIHKRIRRGLPVPEYYGNNLDALYDVLTEQGEPWDIEIVFMNETEERLGAYLLTMKRMCEAVEEENPCVKVRWERI